MLDAIIATFESGGFDLLAIGFVAGFFTGIGFVLYLLKKSAVE